MSKSFTPEIWKDRVAIWWRDKALDWKSTMAQLSVHTAYGMLTASAFLPLLEAYSPEEPGPAIAALSMVTAGVGSNLVSNVVQGAYNKANAPRKLEKQIAENSQLRAEYEALLTQLDVLAAAQDALGDRWATFEQRLQADLTKQGMTLHVQSGGGVVVLGKISTGGGAFIGRDQINVSLDIETASRQELVRAYYRSLATSCSHVPLGIVDPHLVPTMRKVSLQQVYVDLDVALPARNEQDAVHGLELCLLGENNRERTALMTALTNLQANHIVLLGEPGSGKSTFINYLTYNLARIVSGDGTNHDFPSIFEDLWPMRLRLRDVAPHLAAKGHGNAGMVWDAVRADLVRNFGESAASKLFPYLQGRLMQKGIFLLDGLDEVPVANRGRECLIEAVQALLEQVPERRVLLTARPYAYVDPEWQLPGLPVLALKPFSTTQVNRFVQNWHLAMQPVMGWSPAEVNERNERLRIALRERHRLADLASRPLLLTLMTTLHTSWGRLPADRAELYEESVKLLLDRWQKAHSSYNPEHAESSSAITTKLYTDLSELRGALEELAYDAHVAQGKTVDRDHTPADISQDQVLAVLSRYLPRDVNPRSALPYLQNRVGLLVESHPKVYTFPHRSFQEYLAACFLAETKQDFGECLRDLVWDDMGWWREVFLLGLGKAKQGGIGNALNVLNTLVPSEPVDVMEPTCSHWRVAVLAGEGLLNLSPTNKTVQTPHYRALVRRVSRWLVLLIERGVLSASERAVAGDVLGQLGDLRFDSSFLYLPKTYQSIQEKYWGFIEVPAGPFVTKEGSKERQETIHYNYWMARYPITVAEYGSFVDDKGYEIRSYWSPVGWAWRTGEWDEQVENVGPRKWLKRRSVELRNRPMWWEKQQRHPNRPIVFVSWFEAVAYCAWLTEQLLSQDPSWLLGKDVDSLLLGARLPLVSEWEKAARGGDARCYPWGDEDWDAEKANIEESGISHASTVGLYPEGANPWGLHELSGNVWEWTNSRWAVESKKLIVCGGSWASARTDAHCSSRYSFFPSVAYFNIGFRVVIAPTKFQEIAPKTDSSSEL